MALFKNDQDLKDQLEATKAEVVQHEAVIAQRESEIINITEQMPQRFPGDSKHAPPSLQKQPSKTQHLLKS